MSCVSTSFPSSFVYVSFQFRPSAFSHFVFHLLFGGRCGFNYADARIQTKSLFQHPFLFPGIALISQRTGELLSAHARSITKPICQTQLGRSCSTVRDRGGVWWRFWTGRPCLQPAVPSLRRPLPPSPSAACLAPLQKQQKRRRRVNWSSSSATGRPASSPLPLRTWSLPSHSRHTRRRRGSTPRRRRSASACSKR